MKYLKVLGLAAVAAMVVMAFGAGSASAAVKLCVKGVSDGKCPTGKEEYNGSHIEAKVTNPPGAVLTTNITTVTCTESVVTLSSKGATEPTGEVTNLSFTGCKTSANQACTVEVVNLPYTSHIEGAVEGTNTSKLRVTDEVGAGAKVVCGFVINCTFTTKEATLTGHNITTPTTTEFTAVKVPLTRNGGICPTTAEWTASYSVTTPEGFTVH